MLSFVLSYYAAVRAFWARQQYKGGRGEADILHPALIRRVRFLSPSSPSGTTSAPLRATTPTRRPLPYRSPSADFFDSPSNPLYHGVRRAPLSAKVRHCTDLFCLQAYSSYPDSMIGFNRFNLKPGNRTLCDYLGSSMLLARTNPTVMALFLPSV